MEFLLSFLPIIIYVLLIVLLVVCITFLVKALNLLNRAEYLLNDIEDKVSALNGLFKILTLTTDRINSLSDKVIETIISFIGKLFHKRKEEEDE